MADTLTRRQAADRLGVSLSTIDRMIRRRLIEVDRLPAHSSARRWHVRIKVKSLPQALRT